MENAIRNQIPDAAWLYSCGAQIRYVLRSNALHLHRNQIIRGGFTKAHLCHRLRIFGSNALHLHSDILVYIHVIAGSAHAIDIVRLVCGGIDSRGLIRIPAGTS